ncbi:MAG: hypothetical protein CMP23_01155 [Rickettsiales bacterium]|nr:hypothetical protein [Rickettsiales bacterium]|tara:strand:- start:3310 stop:3780 length:471 start_codon:yes stop_codon:yes gene_type:complete
MISVEVPYSKRFIVAAPLAEAFALVADVHRSGMHFPGVDSIVQLDAEGCWRWSLAERGFGPIKFRARYQAIYQADAAASRVEWRPAPRPGDMESYGCWELAAESDVGTSLYFEARTIAHIPAPRMMASMVDSFARNELIRLKDLYLDAISKTLNGV